MQDIVAGQWVLGQFRVVAVLSKFLICLSLLPLSAWAADPTIQVILDSPPSTLNPRHTVDASGQRLNFWMFRSLTRINPELEPTGDLAESWKVTPDGKTWSFELKPGLADHAGEEITPERVLTCMENYRKGEPQSFVKNGFPNWEGTELKGRSLLFRLKEPDPYLPRNVTLLRYFRTSKTLPCAEPPPGEPLITSGPYRPKEWNSAPDREITMIPAQGVGPSFRFRFIRDENSRMLILMSGEADAIQNALSLTKTRWVQKHLSDRYTVIEREGVNVSYLSFNVKDPILAHREVRQAIAHAIDRTTIVRDKMFGFGSVASSLLSPRLPEAMDAPISYDLILAERLLDQAGFKKDAQGKRFVLKYRTTTSREGIETALMIREMLKKIGIEIQLEVVEPAVFLMSIRKGRYQLFSSRWIGIADASILHRTLRSGQTNARAGYSDPKMDELLDSLFREMRFPQRVQIAHQVQTKMLEDFPYLPLWFWNNALILSKKFKPLRADELSLSGAFDPLMKLQKADQP